MVDLCLVRLLLSITDANIPDTSHFDVKIGFLEAILDEKIWLSFFGALHNDTTSQKIVVDVNAPAGEVLRLRRSLYVLKQVGFNWYKEVYAMIVKKQGHVALPPVPRNLLGPGCGCTNLSGQLLNSRDYSCDQGRDLILIQHKGSGHA